jgi:hypothetical protein
MARAVRNVRLPGATRLRIPSQGCELHTSSLPSNIDDSFGVGILIPVTSRPSVMALWIQILTPLLPPDR